MGKILKVLLVLLVVALLTGLSYWTVVLRGKPWWFAAAISAGVLGVLFGLLFLKKYLLRRRERRFVQRVIDQDTESIERAPVTERHELVELQEKWKESVRRLQQSHLRKLGNPLYVLPWFLIMGESKAGKTSAVKNAGQDTPMSEVSRSAGISGTRNCDWWFFEQAIVLDTAGRYTIPLDEGPDLEEWKRFLELLGRYRRKEPLNGVVVAVAADKLVKPDQARLREEGRSIRQRIDQMMRIMGAKFPVYVLVTKMDLVHGFTQFNQSLEKEQVAQAMGYTNTALGGFWRDVLREAVAGITGNLKKLRFLLAHRRPDPDPGALFFPTEFERLVPGLAMFLEAVFAENPYQETPLLRGLYFSSALRRHSPVSDFLEATGIEAPQEAASSPQAGFFLKDFFAAILPRDRNLFSPLREFVLWRRLTRSLGLLSWTLLWLAACGLLGISYYRNHAVIRQLDKAFSSAPVLSGKYDADLLMLDKMRIQIRAMEGEVDSWSFLDLGLDHGRRLLAKLKRDYLKLLEDGFLTPVDRRMMARIENGKKISRHDMVDYAGYVVAQLWVLGTCLDGRDLPPENDFRIIAANILSDAGLEIIPEIAQKFGDVYLAYLRWNRDRPAIEARVRELQVALVDLIEKRSRNLHWLIQDWIPETASLGPDDFAKVPGAPEDSGKPEIPGAFTGQGRKHIERFISYIDRALDDMEPKGGGNADPAGRPAAAFQRMKKDFWDWYHREFFRRWHYFMARFPKALTGLKGHNVRQQLALMMTGEQNPYFRLIKRAGEEVKALGQERVPPVFGQLVRMEHIRELALAEQKKQKSVKAELALKAEELKAAMDSRTDSKQAEQMARDLSLAHAWNRYVRALAKVNVDLTSTKWGYDTYKAALVSGSGGSGGGDQPPALVEANSAYASFKAMMDDGKTDSAVIWDLVCGPQDYLLSYAASQAACFIQQKWRQDVLSFLEDVDPAKVPLVLFDKQDGLVWKFLDKTAKPFISRGKAGFIPRRDFRGRHIAFRPAFMHFLNQGRNADLNYQPEYKVELTARDLQVNPGVENEPFESVLRVNCADRALVLENFNYPRTETFAWSPEKCGDTYLTIKFAGFELKKRYKGRLGFAKFLKDFRNGSHIFPAGAFPVHKSDLKRAGISFVKISYRIKGQQPVIRLLEKEPTRVPSGITRCNPEP